MDLNSRTKSRRRRAYHQGVSLVYHQHKVLNIIKPQENARWRVMRYKGGSPPLMICTARCAAMIYQACGSDKKIRQVETCRIFWQGLEDLILARTTRSVFHGRGRPPEVRSVPFPLQVLLLSEKEKGTNANALIPVSLAGAGGLEPTTLGFGDRCSTD